MPVPRENEARRQWRENNADLIAWLEERNGSSSFLSSLNRSFQEFGSLTDNQTNAARRIMNNSPREQIDEATQSDEAFAFNGTFTARISSARSSIDTFTGTYKFRIHTVVRGVLAGKRIIKYEDPEGIGGWRGFAFLTTAGEVRVWSRFRGTENPYVENRIEASRLFMAAMKAMYESMSTPRSYDLTTHLSYRHVIEDKIVLITGLAECRTQSCSARANPPRPNLVGGQCNYHTLSGDVRQEEVVVEEAPAPLTPPHVRRRRIAAQNAQNDGSVARLNMSEINPREVQ